MGKNNSYDVKKCYFKIPIFKNFGVNLILCQSVSEGVDYCVDKLGMMRTGVMDEENTEALAIRGGGYLIMIIPYDSNDSIVWHESLHIAGYTMVEKNIPYNEENDELIAYLQEFIHDQVDERLKRIIPEA